MRVENKKRSKIIKFLNGKAFYAILCICFVGIGVAAWSGVQGLKAMNGLKNAASSHGSTVSSQPSPLTGQSGGKNDTSASSGSAGGESSKADRPAAPSDTSVGSGSGSGADAEETAGGVATFFVSPVIGAVMKDYSDTELLYSMTYNDLRIHRGVDIAAPAGTPVTSAGSGKVTKVETDPLYGTVVEIDHGNGITARYCGLNGTPCVNPGDTVDSSTQLGTVDEIPCESVEERHLHLEFYFNGEAVSPLKYINN